MDSVADFDGVVDLSPRGTECDLASFGCHVKHRIRSHIGPIEHVAVFAGLVLSAAADMIKVGVSYSRIFFLWNINLWYFFTSKGASNMR